MLRFFIVFLLIQGILFAAELLQPVQQHLIIPFTTLIAHISAWLVQRFDSSVIAHGVIIQNGDNGFAVSIQAGCNGVEASIVLIAAMLAFPAPWKHRLIGITLGFLSVQAMNLLRIISLFYIGQWDKTAFEWAHLYIWQALIMLDVLIVFLVWLRFLPARQTPPSQHAEPAHAA